MGYVLCGFFGRMGDHVPVRDSGQFGRGGQGGWVGLVAQGERPRSIFDDLAHSVVGPCKFTAFHAELADRFPFLFGGLSIGSVGVAPPSRSDPRSTSAGAK